MTGSNKEIEESLCRNCDDTPGSHCPQCGACYSEPATSHTINGSVMKYPRYCGNENNCDIADRYEKENPDN
tara:strand:- start:442 stop:654 length:213 start_codon:yes stop_codon:yes gene_type:complete